jgi:predicted transcriptional regulator YheO
MKTFELIAGQIPPDKIRTLGLIKDDEFLQYLFAYYVCEAAGYLKVPTKSHKVEIAKKLIDMGIDSTRVRKMLKISESTIYRMKRK